ncbi:hypothetical protein OX284_012930 [Flavobacterium sp. SUN046]|uniref:hypothetical protein n=1 Tax=Flavobacterium sp. SUN046 TaxID=3002440 RepID=UPI002DB8B7E8|nr:hypothetical protein [Flavobacterium sp. SUN046]MEC4050340.1 hypothetical protein [Flavobacterium sp. SUN046]
MESIVDKIKETTKAEEKKNASDKSLREFEKLLVNMDKLGCLKKPDYSLPLVDTIGKTTYSTLNKHSV